MIANNGQQTGGLILVVDDEVGMREGCRRALTPLGYRVDTSPSLAAARQQIQSRSYDLALVDVMLPDGSGLDLIGPLLDRDPLTVCIIITGFASIELAIEAIRRGAFDFLSKPFTAEELIVTVNQGLERRRLKAIEIQAQELARAKEQLDELEKTRGQFMLGVAHELRSPLAAVQSYVNLILEGYIPDEEIGETLGRVQSRLQQMLDLIGDLTELARLKLTRGQPDPTAGPQSPADLLTEVCDMLRDQISARDQHLQVEIVDRPLVIAQADHLRLIWLNLLSNAIKYTPPGGSITVRLQATGDRLIGAVEDTGMGIAGQDLPYLFKEFFRTDQAKASGTTGTGLGLALVKQIVERYQGEITVRSQPEQGSCFTFSLPLAPPGAAQNPQT